MDLYSAAQRMGRPMSFGGGSAPLRELPIAARGLIGDGVTSALVRADGVIDWLCMPRFDSPSVFGALLDRERGGATGITPRAPFTSLQRYDPDTNVLETLFTVPGQGALRVTDSMPWSDDPRAAVHEVHRHIQCVEGCVELELLFDPRFDYGRGDTRVERHAHGLLAKSGASAMAAVANLDVGWREGAQGVRGTCTLRRGERRWMVLSWDAVRPEPILAYRPYDHLRSTRRHWRQWAAGLRYDGPWRHHVVRSALLLKALIHAPSGAMVAAPTTALPEWPGGTRNWDYRYTWVRDAAMAVRAANLVGCQREALEFFHFLRDALEDSGSLRVMYAIDGSLVPAEHTLDHVRGYADSQPVRIGNGAREQVQLDSAGAVLDAAQLFDHFGGVLLLRTWRQLTKVVDDVARLWPDPDHGIWEPRARKRHHVHSKLMCWLTLDRGAELAKRFGGLGDVERWRAEADRVRKRILHDGLDPQGKRFVSTFGGHDPDASLLLLPIHGLLPPDDPRIAATLDWVKSELSAGSYLRRYKYEDGVGGDEGAFVLCGFWLAEALAMAGRIDEAQEVFVAHAEASNHVGLLAEEIDPRSGAFLGNFPQAFSHLGLINAACRIDRALRMRDEGLEAVPHLVGSAGRG